MKIQWRILFSRFTPVGIPGALGADRCACVFMYLYLHEPLVNKVEDIAAHLLLGRSLGQHIPIPDIIDVNIFRVVGFMGVLGKTLCKLGSNFGSDSSSCGSCIDGSLGPLQEHLLLLLLDPADPIFVWRTWS